MRKKLCPSVQAQPQSQLQTKSQMIFPTQPTTTTYVTPTTPTNIKKRCATQSNILQQTQSQAQLQVHGSPQSKKTSYDEDKEKMYNSLNLTNCRSHPNISNFNGYIKLDANVAVFKAGSNGGKINNMDANLGKFVRSPNKIGIGERVQKLLIIDQKQQSATSKTAQNKKPKFIRRTNLKGQLLAETPTTHYSSATNLNSNIHNESFNSAQQFQHQNASLRQKLSQSQQKIKQLQQKIQSMDPKSYLQKLSHLQQKLSQISTLLSQKDKTIEQLTLKATALQQQKNQLQKSLSQMAFSPLPSQNDMYKMFSTSLEPSPSLDMDLNALNNSSIGLDMMSTAQYIESLTDLEDELHHKKTEIFDLNKLIEQLKIKAHVSQIRHEENMKRIVSEWQAKYKRLMNMYKNLKGSKYDCNFGVNTGGGRMSRSKSKGKGKGEYLDEDERDRGRIIYLDKDELFNLSLSTDRSQVPYY